MSVNVIIVYKSQVDSIVWKNLGWKGNQQCCIEPVKYLGELK